MVKNLPRHLKSKKHNIRDPLKILSQNPFYKTAKPRMKKRCPLCNLSISRVAQHLRRKHNLSGESLYKMSKSAKKIHFQESVNEIATDKEVENKECEDKVCSPSTSNVQIMLSKPSTVKENESASSSDVQDMSLLINNEVLMDFKNYMDSLAGGARVNSKIYANQVSHILKIVGYSLFDLLPDNVCSKYFDPFFQSCKAKVDADGNSHRQRKPASLISYLYAFKSFTDYLFFKFPHLRNSPLTYWNEHFPKWLQTARKEQKKYKSEKEQNKIKNLLLPKHYLDFLKNSETLEQQILDYDNMLVKLGNPKIFLEIFKDVRNYLVIRICIENSCSPFAIQHFEIEDLNNGSDEDGFMLAKISQCKTMSAHDDGPLLISSEIRPIFRNYLRLRELFQTSHPYCRSVFPSVRGTQLKAAYVKNILSKAFQIKGLKISRNFFMQMAMKNVSDAKPNELFSKNLSYSARMAEAHCTLKRRNALWISNLSDSNSLQNVVEQSETSDDYSDKEDTECHQSSGDNDAAGDAMQSLNYCEHPKSETCEPSKSRTLVGLQNKKRLSWDSKHLDVLKSLFSKFIKNKKVPVLKDVRIILQNNQSFYEQIIQERLIDINKQSDLNKLLYAVLSKVKTFL